MNGNTKPSSNWARYFSILLPIREAYEWKQRMAPSWIGLPATCFQFVKRMNGNGVLSEMMKRVLGVLLPIREAYEWKPLDMDTKIIIPETLLPIREAYEWKLL